MQRKSTDVRALFAYTRADIRRALRSTYCDRGEDYARKGRVSIFDDGDDGSELFGHVRGSSAIPYDVSVSVMRSRGEVRIIGTCDCPVGEDCKHVAAMLYAAIMEYERDTTRGSVDARLQPALFEIAMPDAPKPVAPPPDPVSARATYWLERIARASDSGAAAAGVGHERIAYVFDPTFHGAYGRFPIHVVVERLTKAGRWAKVRETEASALAAGSARAVAPDDMIVGSLLKTYENAPSQKGALTGDIVRRIIATGRARLAQLDAPSLSLGPQLSATLTWEVLHDGTQRPSLRFDDPGVTRLPCAGGAWYVRVTNGVAGKIEVADVPPVLLETLLTAPALEIAEVAHVRDALPRVAPHARLPLPLEIVERVVAIDPVPLLTLKTVASLAPANSWYRRPPEETLVDIAELHFIYGETIVSPESPASELRRLDGTTLTIVRRSPTAERAAIDRLARSGLLVADHVSIKRKPASGLIFRYPVDDDARWQDFALHGLDELAAAGWRIEFDPAFRRRIVALDDESAWSTDVAESASGWFDLSIGVDVQGKRYDLLPILRDLLQRDELFARGRVAESEEPASDATASGRVADRRFVYVSLPGSTTTVALPAARVRAILTTLAELHDPDALRNGASLRLPLARAAALSELEAAAGLRWDVPKRLRDLGEKLRTFSGIERVAVPKSFRGELRAYQHDGLDWLQFLARYGFGGILADDMGLGKSVQTLAHLLREKESRRLTRPALLVVPTSLVFNWCSEAARFAPKLRVLSLHGPTRAERFSEIDAHDVVITTYALLVRDTELHKREWHAAILDEAQALKNPLSKAAQIAMGLRADHRVLLTGTPVENHLGDLWSLFSIALPGALGDRKQFGLVFRTPIEKRGDASRGVALAQRIRPFLLRRTKDIVASELPEKTEIVHRVELGGPQRDLYETIRIAMHRRVREQIEERGLARSQIVILDALLKLRQVCCDPRLLPPALRKTTQSAKLEALLEMLPQLVEEGRRILLFSQFTSMLDLIEPELQKRDIPFVVLTGQTKDRASIVKRFQAGEVPVFLISLKAGGTGLNLIAADTVIHYDPWWNPAVERQATDRAHRIGQTQHVFVYKFIGAGTLEEKMLALQGSKSKLAAAIYAEGDAASARISAADVEMLFAPIG
jgi:hypothetical protein